MDLLAALEREVLVADGGIGTALQAAGAPPDACLEELSVSWPDLVRGVHEGYLAAGARLISTNTFGANAVRLAAHGLSHRVGEINWIAAQLARDVAGPSKADVAAIVGPTGLSAAEVETRGIELEQVFSEQLGALHDGGARIVILATFTNLPELQAAIRAKHGLHHCPVVACVACDDSALLPDGTPAAEALHAIRAADADVVGLNCTTVGPALLAALEEFTRDVPLAVFPSAGIPQNGTYPVTPERFATNGLELTARGVRLLGGCCGVRPAHIAALAEALNQR